MSVVSTSISHSSTPQRRKKDVSVTFSRCQVWREEEEIKRERKGGDLRDLSMYALHNLFICLGKIDWGCSLSETYRELHKYSHNFTDTGVSQEIWRFLEDSLRFLLSRKNWGLKDCKNVFSFTTVRDLRCVAKFVITRALWTFDYWEGRLPFCFNCWFVAGP